MLSRSGWPTSRCSAVVAASDGPTDAEQRLHPGLLSAQHELGESLRLGGGDRAERVHDVAQRVARHQGQAFVEQREGGFWIGCDAGAGGLGEPRVRRQASRAPSGSSST